MERKRQGEKITKQKKKKRREENQSKQAEKGEITDGEESGGAAPSPHIPRAGLARIWVRLGSDLGAPGPPRFLSPRFSRFLAVPPVPIDCRA